MNKKMFLIRGMSLCVSVNVVDVDGAIYKSARWLTAFDKDTQLLWKS